MANTYLIIGATGAIGYAVTKAVQEIGETATLLVRDKKKASKLLGDLSGLTVVEGDIYDTKQLCQLAKGHSFIFHGSNASYEHWASAQPAMMKSVIEAASASGATVIFPGNNYNHGPIEQPISEITPFNPTTELGRVRVEVEKMLQLAVDQRRVRALVVRLAEIWGPNVTNKQFAPVFENILRGKAMPWLISAKTPQQLLYNLDAGRAIVALSRRTESNAYDVVNIGGETVPSIETWLDEVAHAAGKPAKVSVTPKAIVNMLGHLIPVMREVASMSYKFDQTISLNDDRFRAMQPEFRLTPMNVALEETLAWFRTFGTHSKATRAERRNRLKKLIWSFVVDNIAIGIFPALIAVIASLVPQLKDAAIYIAVAAGIYWTPGLHKLANGLKGKLIGAN